MTAFREAFGKSLLELGRNNKNIVVLDADLASSTKVAYFAQEFPDRFFQCGISEQNMIGVAAGLASCGKIPFVASFAVFVTKRPADQISISIAYPKLNVKIIGAYTGLFNGRTGATHMAGEDMAIMRAIPGIIVIDPSDVIEMDQAMETIANYYGPVYMRETRDEWPDIFDSSYKFEIGKAAIVKDGNDAAIISCGVMTSESLIAAEKLKVDGINVRVVNMSTIKPIDREAVIKSAMETGAIVTCENHNIYGGLGSAVAEVLVEEACAPMLRIGIKDVFNECGTNKELLEKYQMSSTHIAEAVKKVIKKKK
ncbi:MAG: transketolase family protein [Actinobacteria bacterium]|nr:transketolase family protein [Actinomycetota bacterium]MCL6088323.1 transketolase family protein [Actinomycetota bacterium]